MHRLETTFNTIPIVVKAHHAVKEFDDAYYELRRINASATDRSRIVDILYRLQRKICVRFGLKHA